MAYSINCLEIHPREEVINMEEYVQSCHWRHQICHCPVFCSFSVEHKFLPCPKTAETIKPKHFFTLFYYASKKVIKVMKAYNRYKTKKLLFLQKAPSDAFMTFYEALYANVLFLNFLNTSEPEV